MIIENIKKLNCALFYNYSLPLRIFNNYEKNKNSATTLINRLNKNNKLFYFLKILSLMLNLASDLAL